MNTLCPTESGSYDEVKDFDHQISENAHRFFHNERQRSGGSNEKLEMPETEIASD